MHTPSGRRASRTFLSAVAAALLGAPAQAHEAWLLTPAEIARLEQGPLPDLFLDPLALGAGTAVALGVVATVFRVERLLRPAEARLLAPLARLAAEIGPLTIRIGLALMLMLAAAGGLPRHGTPRWSEATLLVPDMELSLAPGWAGLAALEVALALLLVAGLATRIAGLGVVALSLLGLAAFGTPFLDYALHIAAPGLVLAVFGGGRLAVDRYLGAEAWLAPGERAARFAWHTVLALMGLGFVYLGVTCKLLQPMLVMAILDHGGVPVLGLPLALVALVMSGVEVVAGLLLALGRFTRPVALFLIGAFTFFSVTLGENPLFHANLYAMMVLLVLSGRDMPRLGAPAPAASGRAALVPAE